MRSRAPRASLLAAALLGVAASVPGASAQAATTPLVEHMVVFRDGRAPVKTLRAGAVTVRASGRRCAVGAGTPLAALVRSRAGALSVRDFGSCSRRARDAGSLFVRGIGSDRNAGRSGWVYKVGQRLGTAGAGDPRGPFGRGAIRSGARVLWFYCQAPAGTQSCQRTLAVEPRDEGGGVLSVRVSAFDNEGRGVAAPGATVVAGGVRAEAGPDGVARLSAAPGTYSVHAEQPGLVRSFAERTLVR
jgi:hypothetical protein